MSLTVLALLLACGSNEPDVPEVIPLVPPAPGEGFQLEMNTTAPAYSEVWDCAVYPIPIDTISNVNWVEFQQNPGTHHMTLSTPFGSSLNVEPGVYPCDEIYTGEFMENQVMFFGNQGTADGILQLPEGVAANMPPNIDIVHEVHFVNPTDTDIELYSRLNAWLIPDSEVTSGIWGGSVRDEHINIPANGTHTEWTRCVMNEDVEVLFLASHTHEKGVEFTIAPFDGTATGEIFYRNDDWHDPKIVQYEEPIIVPAGEGFEFACTWENEEDREVNYGLNSTDEMCNMAIVHTPFSITAQCEVVESSDGVLWTP